MGAASTQAAYQRVFGLGADQAYLLSSKLFAGADVLATAYTLSAFLQNSNTAYDLILCGDHSSDGGTGHIGACLAGIMQLPHICSVSSIAMDEKRCLRIHRQMDGIEELFTLDTPCIIITKPQIAAPYTPPLSEVLKSRRKKICILDENNLPGLKLERCGAEGSATKIKKLSVFAPRKNSIRMVSLDDEALLLSLLGEKRIRL
jgi:electron transfer flavoprotein beta subunit